MRIRIRGGTVTEGSESLCHTCRFCTAHIDREPPTVRAMKEIAWVLRTDPKRKQIGFVQPKELSQKDRYVLCDD